MHLYKMSSEKIEHYVPNFRTTAWLSNLTDVFYGTNTPQANGVYHVEMVPSNCKHNSDLVTARKRKEGKFDIPLPTIHATYEQQEGGAKLVEAGFQYTKSRVTYLNVGSNLAHLFGQYGSFEDFVIKVAGSKERDYGFVRNFVLGRYHGGRPNWNYQFFDDPFEMLGFGRVKEKKRNIQTAQDLEEILDMVSLTPAVRINGPWILHEKQLRETVSFLLINYIHQPGDKLVFLSKSSISSLQYIVEPNPDKYGSFVIQVAYNTLDSTYISENTGMSKIQRGFEDSKKVKLWEIHWDMDWGTAPVPVDISVENLAKGRVEWSKDEKRTAKSTGQRPPTIDRVHFKKYF